MPQPSWPSPRMPQPSWPQSKDATAISDPSPQTEISELKRGPGRTMPVILWPSASHVWSPRSWVMGWRGKEKVQRTEMNMKRMTSKSPDSCTFHTWKSAKFLWDIWFCLITNNPLKFRLPAPCCKFIWPDSPSASSEQFSLGLLEMC